MRRLIINADDLGISQEVDIQIEECIRRGVITSSTLMANAPAFYDGIRIAKQYPQISVGVHLNLIEFAPLTNTDIFKKHGVVDDAGNFIEGAIFCVHIDDELKQAVFEEWDAQINKVKSAGVIPTHCDSHQHTHTIPAFRNVLCQVLNKHGIHCVRRKYVPSIRLMLRQKNRPTVKLDKSKAMLPPKRNVFYRRLHIFMVIRNCRKWNKQMLTQYTMTDGFFHFNSFYYDKKVLDMGGCNATIELMCHPGLKAFQDETDILMHDKSWIACNEYKLVSYKEL